MKRLKAFIKSNEFKEVLLYLCVVVFIIAALSLIVIIYLCVVVFIIAALSLIVITS
jgi:uncharacterized membrane protein